MDTVLWQLVLQLVLILLNALFACAEIAMLSTNEPNISRLASEGNRRAARLLKLKEQPAKFLATIQVAITLSGFLGSAFAADNFAERLMSFPFLINSGIPLGTLKTISVIVITLVLSYFTLVLGELVPKRLAMRNPEKIALSFSTALTVISKLFAPIVWLLSVSTNGILRLMKINPDEGDGDVSEETIRTMADAGSERGVIDETENEIIQNVFEFDDLTAGDLSTHRTEIILLWAEDNDEVWDETIKHAKHSFYPVCLESVDNVIGVLRSRDYFALDDKNRELVMKEAVIPACFVPESMKADILFRKMRDLRLRFAVVTDEYGGTHGIITITDLLERLVGAFDEDSAPEPVVKDENNIYRIDCSADLLSLSDIFEDEPESDAVTVGGWITELFGHIPETDEETEFKGFRMRVTKADKKRVLEITAEKLPEESEDDGDGEKKGEK